MLYFRVIAGKAPNILTGRGMLAKGFVTGLEPGTYSRHAELVSKMRAKPKVWEQFNPEDEKQEEETQPVPQPTDGLLPHQLEAIRAVQSSATT